MFEDLTKTIQQGRIYSIERCLLKKENIVQFESTGILAGVGRHVIAFDNSHLGMADGGELLNLRCVVSERRVIIR